MTDPTLEFQNESVVLPMRPASRVLLIGWDAADWNFIDPLIRKGMMPHLQAFLERGVRGHIASLTPMLSPMLWTSIATGKRADQHGILGFCEPDTAKGSTRPVASTSRQCLALWNILSRRGLKASAINWFASHPAEAIKGGVIVSDRWAYATGADPNDWTRAKGSIYPESFANDLDELRVHPSQITADQVVPFVPSLMDLKLQEEKRLQSFVTMLAHAASLQAATTFLMQETDWDFLSVYFDEIDRVGHDFMEFHPPKMEHINQAEFDKYKDVMTGMYRFHDMMLGRLMELVGEDATVIILSDHGFHSNELRPKGSSQISGGNPVGWHRPYGVIAACGPHIKKNERVYGASLLDIAPTVLAMLGQPVGDDMDGSVLTNLFEGELRIEKITTHENGQPHDAPGVSDDPWTEREMMIQLAALGYVEDDSVEGVVRDRQRNLGITHMTKGDHKEALKVFDGLLDDEHLPDQHRVDVQSMRAQCMLAMGKHDECASILDSIAAMVPANADKSKKEADSWMIRMRAQLARAKGDAESALELFQQLAVDLAENPVAQVDYGGSLLDHQRWDDALHVFEQAIQLDPDNADAWDGAGTAYYKLDKRDEAIFSYVRAISLQHVKPVTHFKMGIVLAEVGRVRWARRAMETAVEQHPEMIAAHLALAQLLRRRFEDEENALYHEKRACELKGALSGNG